MKRVVLLLIMLLCAFPLFSQQNQDDAPSKEEVIEFMTSMRMRSQLETTLRGMNEQMKIGVKQAFMQKIPNPTEKQRKLMNALLDEMNFDVNVDELLGEMVPVYQRNLTKEDINAITTFYSSTAGQKLLDKMPKMSQEAMQIGAAYAQRKMGPMAERIDKRMEELAKEAELDKN